MTILDQLEQINRRLQTLEKRMGVKLDTPSEEVQLDPQQ
jgi:hypothetical protein